MNKKKSLYRFYKYLSVLGVRDSISFFLNLIRPKNELSILLRRIDNPFFLRKGSTDFNLFYDIFIRMDYDINTHGKPIHTIIDLGANIGLASIYFKNKYPGSKIIAVEPERKNYEMLIKNLSGYENIVCLNNAIWNETRDVFIENNNKGNWDFMVSNSKDKSRQIVKSITLDAIIDQYKIEKISLLKIDIEGSERELFQNNFEKWIPKTEIIVIELHDGMRAGASKSFFGAISNYDFSLAFRGENIICYFHH